MASAPVEFQRHLTLRHIAAVKSIQMLWILSPAKEDIKKILNCKLSRVKLPRKTIPTHIVAAKTTLRYLLHRQRIPAITKIELTVFLMEMVDRAIPWLFKVVEEMLYHQHFNPIPKINFFIHHFTWDNVGSVDGPAILKAYVRNRQSVDFHTWCHLCFYCMEDEIWQFARKMEWENCREFTKSYFPIFWYHKIYGRFPTKKMFLAHDFTVFENERRRGVYNSETIIQNLIGESVFQGSIPAVKYFRRLFGEDKFQELFTRGGFFFTSDRTMIVYLLGEVRDDAVIQSFDTSGDELAYLLDWPWVLFVDTWISRSERMTSYGFRTMFTAMYNNIRREMQQATGAEFGRRRANGMYYTRYYQPFRKLWQLFNQKFGAIRVFLHEAFWEAFQTQDYYFCEIIMESVDTEGRWEFLESLERSAKRCRDWRPSEEFRDDFVLEVLINYGERYYFTRIFSLTESRRAYESRGF